MILTTCAACAAPLAHDAPRCVRCHTRYCNATCQGKLLSFDVSLRFAVGARVECARGDTWAPGRVIKLHYHEAGFEPGFFAPYQIELDGGRLIYAPDDDDKLIREAS